MRQADSHRNVELLHAYGLGTITGDALETVAQHVESCAECRRFVADVPADRFLSELKEVAARPAGINGSIQDTLRDAVPPGAPNRQPGLFSSVPAPPAASPPLSSPVPAALAASPDYEVIREINRGGMGVVYLVRNRRMDRLEALKVVNEALLRRAGALDRFEREMRSAARLNHPHIVAAYSAPPLAGLLAFAMEYIDGIDLQQLVAEQGALPVATACQYTYQAALGLQHAHERQMVHRDIKPGNIMLFRSAEPIIKILDFGLAKATSENPVDAALTGEGQMLGTPQYMAPEQIIGASNADIRADIYGLGCTLYHLLTGDPPYKDKRSVYEVLEAHRHDTARPLDKLRPEVPAGLGAIVAKMMARDPAQRYEQPAQVAEALAPYFMPGVRRQERSHRLARPRTIWGSAIAVLTAGLFAVWGGHVVKVKTPDGTLVISVNEPGAEVFVDGGNVTVTWRSAEEGKQQAVINVQPGEHWVSVKKSGFAVMAKKLAFSQGHTQVFNAELVPNEPPAAATASHERPAAVPSAVPPADHGPVLLQGHSDIVWGVAFSPDGNRLVSGSKDGTVRLWDVGQGKQIREIVNQAETWRTIAWSPDSSLIAAGGNADVLLWNAATSGFIGRLTGHSAQIRGLAFSADSARLATSSCDRQVKLWNAADRSVIKTFSGHSGYASAVTLSRSGKWIASAGWDHTLRVWDTASGDIRFHIQNQPGVGHSVAFNPDESLFVSGTSSGHVRIWNMETGNLQRELVFPRHSGRIWGVAFNAEGTALAVGADLLLGLWNPATGNLIQELAPMHRSGVLSLAWSSDGRRLATGSGDVDGKQDGSIGVWTISDR